MRKLEVLIYCSEKSCYVGQSKCAHAHEVHVDGEDKLWCRIFDWDLETVMGVPQRCPHCLKADRGET